MERSPLVKSGRSGIGFCLGLESFFHEEFAEFQEIRFMGLQWKRLANVTLRHEMHLSQAVDRAIVLVVDGE